LKPNKKLHKYFLESNKKIWGTNVFSRDRRQLKPQEVFMPKYSLLISTNHADVMIGLTLQYPREQMLHCVFGENSVSNVQTVPFLLKSYNKNSLYF